MKKLILLFILCLLILIKIGFSTLIKVNINEEIKSKIVSETTNFSFNVVKFSTEFYNIGSIDYSARARIFVYSDDKLIFSGWSQEKGLMSGDKKSFDIYWYAKSPGKYKSKLRFYFGNEIIDSETKELQINETLIPKDVFEISNFRTYDNHVIFDLKSEKDVKNIKVIPHEYVPGWIFEQKAIENIKKGDIKTVSLPYSPTVWKPTTLKLVVVSDNGKYYSEKPLEMKKETGITSIIYSILDSLKLLIL
jgi:hypothetical protein